MRISVRAKEQDERERERALEERERTLRAKELDERERKIRDRELLSDALEIAKESLAPYSPARGAAQPGVRATSPDPVPAGSAGHTSFIEPGVPFRYMPEKEIGNFGVGILLSQVHVLYRTHSPLPGTHSIENTFSSPRDTFYREDIFYGEHIL